MCELSDVTMSNTCMNYLISIGLTPAYDILPKNGSQSYTLKGMTLRKIFMSVTLPLQACLILPIVWCTLSTIEFTGGFLTLMGLQDIP